jgi:hypothetical protein
VRDDLDLAEWYEMIEVRNMYNDYYRSEQKSISTQAKASQNGHDETAHDRRQRVL